MFLVNSRKAYACCGPSFDGQALSRSYGHFFAEFLNDGSLVRLGTLVPTHLCRITVRFPHAIALETFLGTSCFRIASLSASFRRALDLRCRICQAAVSRPRDDHSRRSLGIQMCVIPSTRTEVLEY